MKPPSQPPGLPSAQSSSERNNRGRREPQEEGQSAYLYPPPLSDRQIIVLANCPFSRSGKRRLACRIGRHTGWTSRSCSRSLLLCGSYPLGQGPRVTEGSGSREERTETAASPSPLRDQKEWESLQVKGESSRVLCQKFTRMETGGEKKGKWKWGLGEAVWLFKITRPAPQREEGKEVDAY